MMRVLEERPLSADYKGELIASVRLHLTNLANQLYRFSPVQIVRQLTVQQCLEELFILVAKGSRSRSGFGDGFIPVRFLFHSLLFVFLFTFHFCSGDVVVLFRLRIVFECRLFCAQLISP